MQGTGRTINTLAKKQFLLAVKHQRKSLRKFNTQEMTSLIKQDASKQDFLLDLLWFCLQTLSDLYCAPLPLHKRFYRPRLSTPLKFEWEMVVKTVSAHTNVHASICQLVYLSIIMQAQLLYMKRREGAIWMLKNNIYRLFNIIQSVMSDDSVIANRQY